MRKRIPLLIAFSSSLLFSCVPDASVSITSLESKSEDSFTSSINSSEEISSSEAASSSVENHPTGTQATFFKGTESVSVRIIINNDALYDLSRFGGDTNTYNHKYDDVYFPATFLATIGEETYTYSDVGVRMKGATSRRQIADAQGNITNSCHLKVSFKATFDDGLYDLSLFSKYKHTWASSAARETRKDRRFFGMEKIDFKYLPRNDAATNGKTYSQEIYCFEKFRDNNIPIPYARWVNLTIQSETMERTFKYEAVENIDKRFLKRAFKDKDGDLYKCTHVIEPATTGGMGGWGGSSQNVTYPDLSRDGAVEKTYDENGYAAGNRVAHGKIGVEDNYNNYHPCYSLKTNDSGGENSDFSNMAELINVCYSVCEKGAPLSLLESKIDLNSWLNYCAVAYVLGNYDDFRNNTNNYYIYFRSSDNKAVFIPYDYDYSLGLTKESAVYSNITTKGPFTSSTAHSTNNISLFKDTIITNRNLSYYNTGEKTQAMLQQTYKEKVLEVTQNGALNYDNYSTFVSGLADAIVGNTDETNIVQKYMREKKAVIDAL